MYCSRRLLVLFLAVLAFGTFANDTSIAAPTPCELIQRLKTPNASVTLAHEIAAGELPDIAGLSSATAKLLPAFCRVAATLRPTPDSEIKIEVWLPANSTSRWNQRLQAVGNGGLAGTISYAAMAAALREGYATASTDTGHVGNGLSGEWALNHPEKVIDFGHRAVHEMTVAAKAIVKQYYSSAARYSYWNGCSEGGNQALGAAQRYPNDFDGILAGAPANYMSHLQAGGNWISHAIHRDPATFISPNQLPALNRAVLSACDALDGVSDGIVDDPRACRFDVATLQCSRDQQSDQCFTEPQVAGIKKIYAGAANSRTHAMIFPGYSLGSELDWTSWIVGTDVPPKNRQHLIQNDFFKYLAFNNTNWDWRTFDFDKDMTTADANVAAANSIDPNLNAFKRHGGKLLQYHGWYDPAISPLNSINYFSSVQRRMGDTQAFYRLFMIPGMAHCGGGPGASEFDRMEVLVQWVEHKIAPETITAKGANPPRTRLLCAYPKRSTYRGSGSIDDASNFSCANPKSQ